MVKPKKVLDTKLWDKFANDLEVQLAILKQGTKIAFFVGECMEKYMKLALKEAYKAFDKDEVPIGALIVLDGKVIARAHNLRELKENAIAHAEILCIQKACKKLD